MELLWLFVMGLVALAVAWVLIGLAPRRRKRLPPEPHGDGPYFE
jgi:hypothetical protein